MQGRKFRGFGMVVLSLMSVAVVNADSDTYPEPSDLSLQELLDIEVISVSKHAEPLSNAAAAIYVIRGEEIIRHGYRSIPEALKQVPGLHVAQIDSQKWAVSSRGFNGRYNNKMLVLMDGRTLYSPEFSGVYWETQDTLMADIERIEVVRGPSAAIWGANAVNGVVNIITKHTADTLGGYAELGAGDYEQAFAGFRYGARLADGITARAYAKGFKRDELDFDNADVSPFEAGLIQAAGTENDWWSQQVGGRIDLVLDPASTLTINAAAYDSQMEQTVGVPVLSAPYISYLNSTSESRGWHIMGEYHRAVSANSQFNIKTYFDHAKRDEPDLLGFSRNTFDIELSHQLDLGTRHDLLWGVGFRHISDDLNTNTSALISDNYNETTNLWSVFVQDTITLQPDTWWLTLAARVEHHSYVDVEWQPTIRLSWQPAPQHRFWSALSRAVRTPSHVEHGYDINLANIPPLTPFNPTPFVSRVLLAGNDNYESETVDSLELGYRYANSKTFSVDTALFYNYYDDLRSFSGLETDLSSLPAFYDTFAYFTNDASGYNYGFEMAANWIPYSKLKFGLSYAYIESRFDDGQTQNTDAPEQIVSLNVNWNLAHNIDVVGTWRYVDGSPSIDLVAGSDNALQSYQGVDLGINWQLSPDVTLSVFGRNLFYGSHVEYLAESFSIPYRVEPSFFGQLGVKF